MRDAHVKWLCIMGCIAFSSFAFSEAYDHYLDHKMPLADTKILKKK